MGLALFQQFQKGHFMDAFRRLRSASIGIAALLSLASCFQAATAADIGDWPGSESSLEQLTPSTATVVAAVAKTGDAVLHRSGGCIMTQMDIGNGRVIQGGGMVTYATCRQTFEVVEVLHGASPKEQRVLEYGFCERAQAFPGPQQERAV